jgi:hypothetical protein
MVENKQNSNTNSLLIGIIGSIIGGKQENIKYEYNNRKTL